MIRKIDVKIYKKPKLERVKNKPSSVNHKHIVWSRMHEICYFRFIKKLAHQRGGMRTGGGGDSVTKLPRYLSFGIAILDLLNIFFDHTLL